MAEETLSCLKKTKLLTVLPSITFLNEDEVKSYRCAQCGDVAIYHYVATCNHIFCGKCHSKFSNKACPVENCSNPAINKVTQDKEFELGVLNLKAHCVFEGKGCIEIITLSRILDHKDKCQYSKDKLLPKLWIPSSKDIIYLMEQLSTLKSTVQAMQPDKLISSHERAEKIIKWEINQLESSFDLKLNDIRKDVDASLNLEQKMERKIHELEKRFMDAMAEQKLNLFRKHQSTMRETTESSENLQHKFENQLPIDGTSNSVNFETMEKQLHELERKFMTQMSEQKLEIETNLSNECRKNREELETMITSTKVDRAVTLFEKAERQLNEFEDNFIFQLNTLKLNIQSNLSSECGKIKGEFEEKFLKTASKNAMEDFVEDIKRNAKVEAQNMEWKTKFLEEKVMQKMTVQQLQSESSFQKLLNTQCESIKLEFKKSNDDLKLNYKNKLKKVQTEISQVKIDLDKNCKSTHSELNITNSDSEVKMMEKQMQALEEKFRQEISYQKMNSEMNLQRHLKAKCENIQLEVQKNTETFQHDIEIKLTNFQTEISQFKDDLEENCKRICSQFNIADFMNEEQKMERQMLLALEGKLRKEMTEEKLNSQLKLEQNFNAECDKIQLQMKKSTDSVQHDIENKLTKVQAEILKVEEDLEKMTDSDIAKFKDQGAEFARLQLNSTLMKRNIDDMYRYLKEKNSYKFTWNINGINAIVNSFISGKTTTSNSVVLTSDGHNLVIEAALCYFVGSKSVGMERKLFLTDSNSSKRTKHSEFYQIQVNLIDKSKGLIKQDTFRKADCPFLFPYSQTHHSCGGFSCPIKFLEKGSRYVKDDAVDFEIRLVPTSILDNFYRSDNGILFWELYKYKQLKQDVLDDVRDYLSSDGFYTTENGYKIKMYIHFTQTHLTIYQSCLKGKHDTFLSEKFPHKITITIFDQSDTLEKLHFKRTAESNTVDWAELFLFNYEEIENPKYLKNDCLLMKLIVEHTS